MYKIEDYQTWKKLIIAFLQYKLINQFNEIY